MFRLKMLTLLVLFFIHGCGYEHEGGVNRVLLPYYSGCISTIEKLQKRFDKRGVVEVSSFTFDRKMYYREKIIGYVEFKLRDTSSLLVSNDEYMDVFISSYFSDCMPESNLLAGEFKSYDRENGHDGIYSIDGGRVLFHYNDESYKMPEE